MSETVIPIASVLCTSCAGDAAISSNTVQLIKKLRRKILILFFMEFGKHKLITEN
jgi:hypothetical protein